MKERNEDWIKDLNTLFESIKPSTSQNTTDFDEPDLIYFCAVLSEIAYYQVSELEMDNDFYKRLKVFPCDGLKQVLQHRRIDLIKNAKTESNSEEVQIKVFSSENASVLAFNKNETIFFAFRGTVSPLDWQINLDLKKKSILINHFYFEAYYPFFNPAIKFHQGFAKEVLSLLQEIEGFIEDFIKNKKPPPKLFFTGHSQGGAMASIAHHIFFHQSNYTVASYAFGAPRYMSSPFLYKVNNHPVNIVRSGDIVPYFPPRFFGYDDFFLKKDSNLCQTRDISTLSKFKIFIASILNGHVNHKMECYRKEIAAKSNKQLPNNFFEKILNPHSN